MEVSAQQKMPPIITFPRKHLAGFLRFSNVLSVAFAISFFTSLSVASAQPPVPDIEITSPADGALLVNGAIIKATGTSTVPNSLIKSLSSNSLFEARMSKLLPDRGGRSSRIPSIRRCRPTKSG